MNDDDLECRRFDQIAAGMMLAITLIVLGVAVFLFSRG